MIVIEKLPSAKMLLGAEDATERKKSQKPLSSWDVYSMRDTGDKQDK